VRYLWAYLLLRDSGLISFKCSANALVVLILMPLARDLLGDWQVQRSRLIYDRHRNNIGDHGSSSDSQLGAAQRFGCGCGPFGAAQCAALLA